MEETPKIRLERLVKIFGRAGDKGPLKLLRDGVSKEEILSRTGHVVGVSDVSFSVQQGEVFVVMGLSGSGKSTLVRCINRLIDPTSGHIYVDGEDVLAADDDRLRELRRTKMAMVFQHFALFPHMTVRDNVAYGLKTKGISTEARFERAQETLEIVGLGKWGDRYPATLSGGMQQRVGLARALTTDPDILLMDEPFSALDPLIRRQMQDDLLDLQESIQKTVVFVTHDLDEAVKMGNRIAIMRGGRIIQLGTPEEIVTNPVDDYVEEFVQDVDRGSVLRVRSIMDKTEPLFLTQATIEAAMVRLKKAGVSCLCVVDDDEKPVGLVTRDDLSRAASGQRDDLLPLLRKDFTKIRASATINETYPVLSEGLPVAVVNRKGTFKGILRPENVIRGLK